MNEKFNKNAKVEKIYHMLGKAVRLIVIDPLYGSNCLKQKSCWKQWKVTKFKTNNNPDKL